jgi:urea transport system ATP-binding protein
MTLLSVENIDLHYGAAQALRGVPLRAGMGKATCVPGRNGAGKTPLLRAITGQQPISKGTIRLGGEAICRLASYDRARKGIGFVPQGPEIFPLPLSRRTWRPGSRSCRARSGTSRPESSTLFLC